MNFDFISSAVAAQLKEGTGMFDQMAAEDKYINSEGLNVKKTTIDMPVEGSLDVGDEVVACDANSPLYDEIDEILKDSVTPSSDNDERDEVGFDASDRNVHESDPWSIQLSTSNDEDTTGKSPSDTEHEPIANSDTSNPTTTLNDLINVEKANTMLSSITAGVTASGVNFFDFDNMASEDKYLKSPDMNVPKRAAEVGTDLKTLSVASVSDNETPKDDKKCDPGDTRVPYISSFSLLDAIETARDLEMMGALPLSELETDPTTTGRQDLLQENDGNFQQRESPFVPLRVVERLLSNMPLEEDNGDNTCAEETHDPIVDFLKDEKLSNDSLLAYLQGKDIEIDSSAVTREDLEVTAPSHNLTLAGIDPKILTQNSFLKSVVVVRCTQFLNLFKRKEMSKEENFSKFMKCACLLSMLSNSNSSEDRARLRRMEEWARRGDPAIVRYYREYGQIGFIVFTLIFTLCLWQFYFEGHTEDF